MNIFDTERYLDLMDKAEGQMSFEASLTRARAKLLIGPGL